MKDYKNYDFSKDSNDSNDSNFQKMLRGATGGDRCEMIKIGECYAYGRGVVEKDEEEAEYWANVEDNFVLRLT